MLEKIKEKAVNFFKWLWKQLKDWHNLVILFFVFIILCAPIWVCGILGLIYDSGTLLGVAAAYFAFWLGPITPFWPLCIAITLLIRKGIEKLSTRKDNNDIKKDEGK